MRLFLRSIAFLFCFVATAAVADAPPQVEVAPVIGAQFFRGLGGPGLGQEQGLQNNVLLGARGGAIFGDRLRFDLGFEFIPTMAVGIDRITYVLQPHIDSSIDLTGGWIRPYVGLGVGIIGFVDHAWAADPVTPEEDRTTDSNPNPDVEFSLAPMTGVRLYPGQVMDFLDGTSVRLDVRDVIYAPRNITVNYMMEEPGALNSFHNLQFSLSFAFMFDAFGDPDEDDYQGDNTQLLYK